MEEEKIIYSICIEDIQEVAQEKLDRDLTKEELSKISNKVGDYIDWSQAIEFAIQDYIVEKDVD